MRPIIFASVVENRTPAASTHLSTSNPTNIGTHLLSYTRNMYHVSAEKSSRQTVTRVQDRGSSRVGGRRRVLDLCYSAQTLADVRAAEEARAAYLARHAEDGEVLDMGEMLGGTALPAR